MERICTGLGIDLIRVYATNVFKYFYQFPPADTRSVLISHLEPNLVLLRHELEAYPRVPVITLGEPVLELIVNDDREKKMTWYWDYNRKTKATDGNFRYSKKEENKVGRDIFPLPHQPSINKEFYNNTLENFLQFIRRTCSG